MTELLTQIINCLPKSTDVYYVDRNDSMPAKALASIIEHNGEGDAFEEMDQLLYDWDTSYSVAYYIDEAIERIAKSQGFTSEQLKAMLDATSDDWEDTLRDEIMNRDESTPFRDLARNKGNIIVKLELFSNYDCINSDYCEGNHLDLSESYLADILRMMRINPQDYAASLPECYTCDHVEDVYRGEPLVDAIDVYKEHQELSIGPALWTIVFTLPAVDIVEQYTGLIQVPAGARVGFYGSFGGSGSIFETDLKADFTVDLASQNIQRANGDPYWGLSVDECDGNYNGTYGGYSLDQIYGRMFNFWDIQGRVLQRSTDPLPLAA